MSISDLNEHRESEIHRERVKAALLRTIEVAKECIEEAEEFDAKFCEDNLFGLSKAFFTYTYLAAKDYKAVLQKMEEFFRPETADKIKMSFLGAVMSQKLRKDK